MPEPDNKVLKQITVTLDAIVATLDALDHDGFDVDSSDGKVTFEFEDGSVIIANRQSASNQIWLAEPRGGWHFDWSGSDWRCDKRGVELLETLEGLLSEKVSEQIALR
ncbi:MAG: iron donor protein CyaY [Planctomycetota bacterium]|jgi:CyaY protein|nr:iron donor protein CyaY [Planctomycetota bacterium]